MTESLFLVGKFIRNVTALPHGRILKGLDPYLVGGGSLKGVWPYLVGGFWTNRNRKPHKSILYNPGREVLTWWIDELPTWNIPFANSLMGGWSCGWFCVVNLPDSAADEPCL